MDTTLLLQIVTLGAVLVLLGLYALRNRVSLRSNKRAVIMDSCGLIDGRISDLAQSGFIPEKIIIPSFILKELQYLADGTDAHKRERARFGLDCAKALTALANVSVEVDKRAFPNKNLVDDKLIELAKSTKAQLYTTDFNLIKVAELEGVHVLNVNELAQKLRPTLLPGEKLSVKIVQKGSGHGQGVGYSDDGTMVVIDKAEKFMGKSVDVVVDRMIGTLAGKMIFGRLENTPTAKKSFQKRTHQRKNEDDGLVKDLRSELR